jgi:hypothetical protein
MRRGTIALVALLGLALAPAAAAAPVGVADPADTAYGAPDVLALAADSDATGTLSVATRFAPRPPAGWGMCVPFVPGSPACFPLDMRVDWFLDAVPGAGSLADEGADARVTAVPTRGQSVMELARFDVTRGWVTGPVPGLTQSGGSPTLDLGWQAAFASLGIAPGSPVAIRVVSRYRTFTGLGDPLVYEDRAPDAGGLQVTLAAVPGASAPPPDPACTRAATAVNRAQGDLSKARKRSRSKRLSIAARRKAKRSIPRLKRAVARRRARLKSVCPRPGPASAVPGAPAPAPPGAVCHYETRLTYVIGLDGLTRLEQRVVTVCD